MEASESGFGPDPQHWAESHDSGAGAERRFQRRGKPRRSSKIRGAGSWESGAACRQCSGGRSAGLILHRSWKSRSKPTSPPTTRQHRSQQRSPRQTTPISIRSIARSCTPANLIVASLADCCFLLAPSVRNAINCCRNAHRRLFCLRTGQYKSHRNRFFSRKRQSASRSPRCSRNRERGAKP